MSDARTILTLTGVDRIRFLQDLVTNDVSDLGHDLVYAALLSPQGKYLYDFFLFQADEAIYIDIAADSADGLAERLMLYKLRADVAIAQSDMSVMRGIGEPPEGAKPDPRHAALGWRLYAETEGEEQPVDWDAIRVANLIPETGIELIANESYILELGFERLNGVDFRKGCYVGQEVTARMKHKTALRKGLARVAINGQADPGSEISRDDKAIGTLHTVSGNEGLAYLRFDLATGDMQAGDATLRRDGAEG